MHPTNHTCPNVQDLARGGIKPSDPTVFELRAKCGVKAQPVRDFIFDALKENLGIEKYFVATEEKYQSERQIIKSNYATKAQQIANGWYISEESRAEALASLQEQTEMALKELDAKYKDHIFLSNVLRGRFPTPFVFQYFKSSKAFSETNFSIDTINENWIKKLLDTGYVATPPTQEGCIVKGVELAKKNETLSRNSLTGELLQNAGQKISHSLVANLYVPDLNTMVLLDVPGSTEFNAMYPTLRGYRILTFDPKNPLPGLTERRFVLVGIEGEYILGSAQTPVLILGGILFPPQVSREQIIEKMKYFRERCPGRSQ